MSKKSFESALKRCTTFDKLMLMPRVNTSERVEDSRVIATGARAF